MKNYRIIEIKSISRGSFGPGGKYRLVNTAPVFPGQPWIRNIFIIPLQNQRNIKCEKKAYPAFGRGGGGV